MSNTFSHGCCQTTLMKGANKSRSQSGKNSSIRQRIVDAARAHFFSHGFRSVTMDDLADELGVSKKTLYAHFPGKIDLLEAVLTDKFEGVEAMLKEVTRAQPHARKRRTYFKLSSAAGLHCLNDISETFSLQGNGQEWSARTFPQTLSSRSYWRLFRRS